MLYKARDLLLPCFTGVLCSSFAPLNPSETPAGRGRPAVAGATAVGAGQRGGRVQPLRRPLPAAGAPAAPLPPVRAAVLRRLRAPPPAAAAALPAGHAAARVRRLHRAAGPAAGLPGRCAPLGSGFRVETAPQRVCAACAALLDPLQAFLAGARPVGSGFRV